MNSGNKLRVFSAPYAIWMMIFVIVPLLIMAYYGLMDGEGNFTLANIQSIADPVHLKALWTSVRLSVICTALCFVLALPLAMVIRGLHIKSNGFVIFIFILPMWMNFLLRTIAWQSLLEKSGVINNILGFFGLPAQNMINTEGAIVLGMIYNYLPFMVLPIYNALAKIDEDTFDAAKDLGAGWWQTMRRITFPLILPGIVSGSTMVFVPALTTFVLSDLLGGAKIQLIGNVIEQSFTTANDWNLGAGLSLVLMVLVLASMALMSKYDKNGEGAGIW
ncbi:MAG: ABC transporter permease [Lachnospiraceae bacterium]|nr:ABC transporter permease [Lachnospiraceae bacterium]